MKELLVVICSLATMAQATGEGVLASNMDDQSSSLAASEVIITPVAVKIPIGRILLVRKSSEYCAVRFERFWTGKTSQDLFAAYESYYQGDKMGDFSNKNVEHRKAELSFPKPRGIGRFAFSFGNKDVQCGPIKLFWFGQGWTYFYGSSQEEGDYGIELASTKWTEISEVNVFDSRIRWYRYDAKREDMKIPVDRLWDDKEK